MTTGERIKALRTARGITQPQLADMIGATKQAVSMWEHGNNKPSRISIERMCDLFNVDADYLLCRQSVSMRYLSTEELDLIDKYRLMTDQEKDMVCRMVGIKRDASSTSSLKEA